MSRVTGQTRRPGTRLDFLTTRVATRVDRCLTRKSRVNSSRSVGPKKNKLSHIFQKKKSEKKIKKKVCFKMCFRT